MDLLTIFIVIVVVGIALWAVNSYIPMSAAIKKLLNVVSIAFLVIWLLKVFGIFAYLSKATL